METTAEDQEDPGQRKGLVWEARPRARVFPKPFQVQMILINLMMKMLGMVNFILKEPAYLHHIMMVGVSDVLLP